MMKLRKKIVSDLEIVGFLLFLCFLNIFDTARESSEVQC